MDKKPNSPIDIIDYITLRIVVKEGWKVDEIVPATTIRKRYEAMHFARRQFTEVINSLIAKGLLGGDENQVYLTPSGLSHQRHYPIDASFGFFSNMLSDANSPPK
jgi:hypothetical protein